MNTGKIGFMQGRLSPMIDGQIQAFPWEFWEDEIREAKLLGIDVMEWTLDHIRLYENPLMNSSGQERIREMCGAFDFIIPSVTGDCFMQAPFWKVWDEPQLAKALKKDFVSVVHACSEVGIENLVVPLVDDGSLSNCEEENFLTEFLVEQEQLFQASGVKVIFESDFHPQKLKKFISGLSQSTYGINYDIGNSAALDYDPVEEFSAFGNRILNVHVKDRPVGGTTVPLGNGDADFPTVFGLLRSYEYAGNFILQTARAEDGNHSSTLMKYKSMIEDWAF